MPFSTSSETARRCVAHQGLVASALVPVAGAIQWRRGWLTGLRTGGGGSQRAKLLNHFTRMTFSRAATMSSPAWIALSIAAISRTLVLSAIVGARKVSMARQRPGTGLPALSGAA